MKKKPTLKAVLMSLCIGHSVYASDAALPVSPGFTHYIEIKYEGDSLRQQLSNAGANFNPEDIVKFIGTNNTIFLRTNDNNINLVRRLIEEQRMLGVRYDDRGIVRDVLMREAWDFSAIWHPTHRFGVLRFKSGGIANGKNSTQCKWAVTKKGENRVKIRKRRSHS